MVSDSGNAIEEMVGYLSEFDNLVGEVWEVWCSGGKTHPGTTVFWVTSRLPLLHPPPPPPPAWNLYNL